MPDPVIDKLGAYLDKNPDASDDDVATAFPELSDPLKRKAAFGYIYGLKQGSAPVVMDRRYPQFATSQQPPGKIDLSKTPEVHGSMPMQATEAIKPLVPANTQTTTVEQNHIARVQQAEINKKTYLDQHATMAIKHLNAKAMNEEMRTINTQMANGSITKEQYDQQMSRIMGQMLNHTANEDVIKKEAETNPELQDHILNAAKEIDPENAGKISADQYVSDMAKLDAQRGIDVPLNAAQRAKNAKGIEDQKLIYQNGQVYKPLGVVDTFVSAMKRNHQDLQEADWIKSATPGEIIQKYTDEANARNPDNPIEIPKATVGAGVADLLGGLAPVSGRQLILSGLTNLIPGVGGKIASHVLPALGVAGDMAKLTYTNSFKEHLNKALQAGVDPEKAVADSKSIAETKANIDYAAMAAMGAMPEMNVATENMGPGFKTLVNHAAESVASKVPGGVSTGGLMGAAQIFKNAVDGKTGEDEREGVAQQIMMGGGLHMVTAMLHGAVKLPGKIKDAIAANLSKVEPDKMSQVFSDLKSTGSITPEDEAQMRSNIEQRGALDKLVDPRVTNDEDRVRIANKIQTLNEAREKLKTIDKSYSDEEAKADIKRKEEEVRKLTDESIAKSKEINDINKKAANQVAGEDITDEHEKLFAEEIKKAQDEDNAATEVRGQGEPAQPNNDANAAPATAPETTSDSQRIPPQSEAGGEPVGQAADQGSNPITTPNEWENVLKAELDKTKPTEPALAKLGEAKPVAKPTLELDRIKDEDILKKDNARDIRRSQTDITKEHSVLKSILDCL